MFFLFYLVSLVIAQTTIEKIELGWCNYNNSNLVPPGFFDLDECVRCYCFKNILTCTDSACDNTNCANILHKDRCVKSGCEWLYLPTGRCRNCEGNCDFHTVLDCQQGTLLKSGCCPWQDTPPYCLPQESCVLSTGTIIEVGKATIVGDSCCQCINGQIDCNVDVSVCDDGICNINDKDACLANNVCDWLGESNTCISCQNIFCANAIPNCPDQTNLIRKGCCDWECYPKNCVSHGGDQITHGNSFPDIDGCNTCTCDNGEIKCTDYDHCTINDLHCNDFHDQLLCKPPHCQWLHNHNLCMNCSTISCDNWNPPTCSLGTKLVKDGCCTWSCLPYKHCVTDEGTTYPHLEKWEDTSNQCVCYDGVFICVKKPPPVYLTCEMINEPQNCQSEGCVWSTSSTGDEFSCIDCTGIICPENSIIPQCPFGHRVLRKSGCCGWYCDVDVDNQCEAVNTELSCENCITDDFHNFHWINDVCMNCAQSIDYCPLYADNNNYPECDVDQVNVWIDCCRWECLPRSCYVNYPDHHLIKDGEIFIDINGNCARCVNGYLDYSDIIAQCNDCSAYTTRYQCINHPIASMVNKCTWLDDLYQCIECPIVTCDYPMTLINNGEGCGTEVCALLECNVWGVIHPSGTSGFNNENCQYWQCIDGILLTRDAICPTLDCEDYDENHCLSPCAYFNDICTSECYGIECGPSPINTDECNGFNEYLRRDDCCTWSCVLREVYCNTYDIADCAINQCTLLFSGECVDCTHFDCYAGPPTCELAEQDAVLIDCCYWECDPKACYLNGVPVLGIDIDMGDGCNTCSCDQGTLTCTDNNCVDIPCSELNHQWCLHPCFWVDGNVLTAGSCQDCSDIEPPLCDNGHLVRIDCDNWICEEYDICYFGDIEIPHGTTIPMNDGCNACTCISGQLTCTEIYCPTCEYYSTQDTCISPCTWFPDAHFNSQTGICQHCDTGDCGIPPICVGTQIRTGCCDYDCIDETFCSNYQNENDCIINNCLWLFNDVCIDCNLHDCPIPKCYEGQDLEILGCCDFLCSPPLCQYNGLLYNEGSSWPAGDGCNTCECVDGDIVCTTNHCNDLPCTTNVERYCLAPCIWIGESSDAPAHCSPCDNVECEPWNVPKPDNCVNPIRVDCCNWFCPEVENTNHCPDNHYLGEVWHVDCNVCTCMNDGTISCTNMICPPVPGDIACGPQYCDDRCTWISSTLDAPYCKDCTIIYCTTQDQIQCLPTHDLVRTDCCKWECIVKNNDYCLYDGNRYEIGQSYPHVDGCNRCTCGQYGVSICTEIICQTPCFSANVREDCPLPCNWLSSVTDSNNGICADCHALDCTFDEPPICDDNEKLLMVSCCGARYVCIPSETNVCKVVSGLHERWFETGDSWISDDGCNVCKCEEDGTITCTNEYCNGCIWNDKIIPSGTRIPAPIPPYQWCDFCICTNGKIQCTEEVCPESCDVLDNEESCLNEHDKPDCWWKTNLPQEYCIPFIYVEFLTVCDIPDLELILEEILEIRITLVKFGPIEDDLETCMYVLYLPTLNSNYSTGEYYRHLTDEEILATYKKVVETLTSVTLPGGAGIHGITIKLGDDPWFTDPVIVAAAVGGFVLIGVASGIGLICVRNKTRKALTLTRVTGTSEKAGGTFKGPREDDVTSKSPGENEELEPGQSAAK